MFYSGWEFVSPTGMNLTPLAHEDRQGSAALGTGSGGEQLPLVMQYPLTAEEYFSNYTTTISAAATPLNDAITSAKDEASATIRRCSQETFCSLQIRPKAPQSLEDMQRQITRNRLQAPPGRFQLKSNTAISSLGAVAFMELNVVLPSQGPHSTTNATTSTAGRSHPAIPPLPPLVIGICKAELQPYQIPGQWPGSIGYFTAQRVVMKSEESEGVALNQPQSHAMTRPLLRDRVGCILNFLHQTISFTVNHQIVHTELLEPELLDADLYFSIGVLQQMREGMTIHVRFASGGDGAAALLRLRVAPQPFDIDAYIAQLAWRELHANASESSNVVAAAAEVTGETSAAEAVIAVEDRRLFDDEWKERDLNDTGMMAVVRGYLSARGYTTTLKTLEEEFRFLSPSQAVLYDKAGAPPQEPEALPLGRPPASGSSATAAASSSEKADSGAPPINITAQEAWTCYSASMATLRQLLLHPASAPAGVTEGNTIRTEDAASTAEPEAVAPALLHILQHNLLRPSLQYLIAREAGAVAGEPPSSASAAWRETGASLPSLSPYTWIHQRLPPSAVAMCFLSVRHDILYLVKALHCMEVLWKLLDRHVTSALQLCLPSDQHCRADGTPRCSTAAPLAPSPAVASAGKEKTEPLDTVMAEQTAFTAFFTDAILQQMSQLPELTWLRTASDTGRAVAHHQHDLLLFDAISGGCSEFSKMNLVELLVDDHSANYPYSGALQALASYRQMTLHTPPEQAEKKAKGAATDGPVPPSSPSEATALLEKTLLFMFRTMVTPVPAPSRGMQIGLLQSLNTLLSHVVCLLDKLTKSIVHQPSPSSSNVAAAAGTDELAVAPPHRGISPKQAEAMVSSLRQLMRCAVRRYRWQVWQRVSHAIEEMNAQMEDNLVFESNRCLMQYAVSICNGGRSQRYDYAKRAAVRIAAMCLRMRDGDGSPALGDGHLQVEDEEEEEEEEEVKTPVSGFSSLDWAAYAEGIDLGTTPSGAVEGNSDVIGAIHSFLHTVGEEAEEPTEAVAQQIQSQSVEGYGTTATVPSGKSAVFTALVNALSRRLYRYKLLSCSRAEVASLLSHEELTVGLPTLRNVWRGVHALAVLQPRWRFITEAFAREMSRAICAAPPPTLSSPVDQRAAQATKPAHQRERQAGRDSLKRHSGVTAPPLGAVVANSSRSGSAQVLISSTGRSTVSGSEPDDAEQDDEHCSTAPRPRNGEGWSTGNGDTPTTSAAKNTSDASRSRSSRNASRRQTATSADLMETWFTEELHMSSVYMKKIFKYLFDE